MSCFLFCFFFFSLNLLLGDTYLALPALTALHQNAAERPLH